MNLHLDKEEFREMVIGAANELNIPAPVVEKDYYVTLILKELTKNVENMVFRGGTSLTKCYQLLDRFSEDIDLSYVADTANLSESGKRQLKKSILESVASTQLQVDNLEDTRSRRNYNRYQIHYDSLYETPLFLKPEIAIETFVALPSYPVVERKADNYIYRFLNKRNLVPVAEQYDLMPFPVRTQSLSRTFVDKIFAICDYYLTGKTHLHSRHLYDIYQLYQELEIDDDFEKLVESVRISRSALSICPSAQSGVSIQAVLTEIIKNEVYKSDYMEITEELLFTPLSYNQAISCLQKIVDSEIFC